MLIVELGLPLSLHGHIMKYTIYDFIPEHKIYHPNYRMLQTETYAWNATFHYMLFYSMKFSRIGGYNKPSFRRNGHKLCGIKTEKGIIPE